MNEKEKKKKVVNTIIISPIIPNLTPPLFSGSKKGFKKRKEKEWQAKKKKEKEINICNLSLRFLSLFWYCKVQVVSVFSTRKK